MHHPQASDQHEQVPRNDEKRNKPLDGAEDVRPVGRGGSSVELDDTIPSPALVPSARMPMRMWKNFAKRYSVAITVRCAQGKPREEPHAIIRQGPRLVSSFGPFASLGVTTYCLTAYRLPLTAYRLPLTAFPTLPFQSPIAFRPALARSVAGSPRARSHSGAARRPVSRHGGPSSQT